MGKPAALRSAPAEPSRETQAAVGQVLGHSMGAACSSWGFTEAQVFESAREKGQLLERASRLAGGPEATERLPAVLRRPPDGPLPESWLSVLATDGAPARYRAGPNFVGPFLRFNDGVWEIPFQFGADDERLVIHTQIDRTDIPGSKERLTYVVIEIPLKADRRALRLAPEGVPNAIANDWLLGRPPSDIVIGPDGVRVIGLDREITVTSPLVVSWSLHAPDPGAELTWLQGLIVAQSEHCELRGGEDRIYPYAVLFEGEPGILDVDVQLEFR